MTNPVTYNRTDLVSTITMDDGKVNVFSIPMLRALHEAFDQAEQDGTVVAAPREAGLLLGGLRSADAGRTARGRPHPPPAGSVPGRAHPFLPCTGRCRLHRARVPCRRVPPHGGRRAARRRRALPAGAQRGPDRADLAVVRHRAGAAPAHPGALRPRRGDRRHVRPRTTAREAGLLDAVVPPAELRPGARAARGPHLDRPFGARADQAAGPRPSWRNCEVPWSPSSRGALLRMSG